MAIVEALVEGNPQAGLAGAAVEGAGFDGPALDCALAKSPFVLVAEADAEAEEDPFLLFDPEAPIDPEAFFSPCPSLLLSPAFSLMGLSRQLRELLPFST